MHLDRIWGTGYNTLTADRQPAHETAEEFLYRHQLKDLLQKHVAEFTNTSGMAAGSFKGNDSLTTAGEGVEVVIAHPWALVYVEVREEVVLVSEERELLEELIYEWLSPTEHQCG